MYIENKQLKKYVSYWLLAMFFIISIMIVVGGLTRLTDSGLSITEWQLFTGIIPPFNSTHWNHYFDLYKKIPEYKLQNYEMSLYEFKTIFWWEYIHRFLGRLIGILFLFPLIFLFIKLGFNNVKNLILIFLLICFQGFIGWYMVSSGLVERVDVSHFRLSLHLILAFIILSLIFWNYLKFIKINIAFVKIKLKLPFIFLILLYLQIIIGAFVSGLDAGQIYNSWPFMGNNLFPDDSNYKDLFYLSTFSEPSLVQFIHRNLAYLILGLYLFILFNVYKNRLSIYYKTIILLGFFLLLQILLGILTLLSGAQIVLASMHQISSIFLVSTSIYLLYLNSYTNLQPSN